MNAMDPAAISSLSSLLRSALLQKGVQGLDMEALFKGMGPDLLLRYLGQGAEGARLELPNGVVISAKGELPFPEGTQLRVMLEKGGDVLSLKTLEATPPAAPPLLTPLLESEASALLGRLMSLNEDADAVPEGSVKGRQNQGQMAGQDGAALLDAGRAQQARPPELALTALSQLFRMLSIVSSPQESGISGTLLQQSLPSLGEAERKALLQALDLPEDAAPETMAKALSSLLKEGGQAHGMSKEKAVLLQDAAGWRAAFQALLQKGGLAAQSQKNLEGWFEQCLTRMGAETPGSSIFEQGSPEGGQAPGMAKASTNLEKTLGALLEKSEASRLAESLQKGALQKTALQGGAPPLAEAPEAWEAWVKGGLRVLSDPAACPQEAPFHIAQSKEHTAFFEIPLPWPGAGPLQIWVEEDGAGERSGETEPTQRVLLSLSFSRLGQTRVGFQSQGGALSVRIWTEHPELFAAQQGAMERELSEVAASVSCRVFSLDPGSADPRSLLGGTSWMGMA